METLAVAISDKANEVNAAIRSKLEMDDNGKQKATPILDDRVGELYTYLPAESYILGVNAEADALTKAKDAILQKLKAFNYEG